MAYPFPDRKAAMHVRAILLALPGGTVCSSYSQKQSDFFLICRHKKRVVHCQTDSYLPLDGEFVCTYCRNYEFLAF
jgi:hypothetical protein